MSPLERAGLIEQILASFSFPERRAIDERWATEAEDRIGAYEQGKIRAKPAREVFARSQRGDI